MSVVHPLATTLAVLDDADPVESAFRLDPTGPDWTACDELLADRSGLRAWQDLIEQRLAAEHRTERSRTARPAAGTLLDWYANIPATLAGAMFHVSRRVPRLDPAAVSFRRHRTAHWVSGVALRDRSFWCLSDDPQADHHDATVVEDVATLARLARAQIRDHADTFLAVFDPGVRLPRRSLLGAFFDALDTAAWNIGAASTTSTPIDSSCLLLPGDQLFPASRMYVLTDALGRCHLSHRRVGCCESFRLEDACSTCARTSDDERVRLAAGQAAT